MLQHVRRAENDEGQAAYQVLHAQHGVRRVSCGGEQAQIRKVVGDAFQEATRLKHLDGQRHLGQVDALAQQVRAQALEQLPDRLPHAVGMPVNLMHAASGAAVCRAGYLKHHGHAGAGQHLPLHLDLLLVAGGVKDIAPSVPSTMMCSRGLPSTTLSAIEVDIGPTWLQDQEWVTS